jgi:ubiquinone biosynthesis protein
VDSLRHILRLLSIARTLARHDALFILERLKLAPGIVWAVKLISTPRPMSRKKRGRPGERLARALQDMGPSFIKVGQMLSTRSDLLGEEMAADLSHLQDKLPPFPTALARQAIEEEFGQPIDDLFDHFDDESVAAASIAQVHFAVTKDGQEVAVKVLRPGIEDAFEGDLELFFWGARLLERTRPELKRLKPVQSVATLARSVEMEMDLRFEAAAADELRENFAGDPDVFVPRIDWLRTGQRVLTTERVHGIPFSDVEAIKRAGHDPYEVLKKTAVTFFYQAFRDGLFHGDLHPGNLFVLPDGAIGIVDFGIMGRLDKASRKHLAEMLLGFLTRNYRRAAEVHFEAGWIPPHQSVDEFTQACRSIAEPIMDRSQDEISIARLLGQLFQITQTFEMETQPQLLLLQKTMLVAEGTGRNLAPDANMWLIARPLIEQWMRANLGPQARIRDAAQQTLDALHKIPAVVQGLESALSQFDAQGLKLHPDTVRQLRANRQETSTAATLAAMALGAAAVTIIVALAAL